MDILGTTLRICVDDLEASVAFYEGITGTRALRFERGGVSVAAIGCFLLMSGPETELEMLRKVAATIAVKDVDEAREALTRAGAHIVAGPVPTPRPQPDRPAPGRFGLRVRGPQRHRLTRPGSSPTRRAGHPAASAHPGSCETAGPGRRPGRPSTSGLPRERPHHEVREERRRGAFGVEVGVVDRDVEPHAPG